MLITSEMIKYLSAKLKTLFLSVIRECKESNE